MLSQEKMKQQAGEYAVKFVKEGMTVGVGTGSTIKFFIAGLATMKGQINGAVPSSKATEELLRHYQLPILDLNSCGGIDLYVDGADEVTSNYQMIKGGGAALFREKLIASCSRDFVCIVDETKVVKTLGKFPLAVEVLPMARSYVARQIVALGGVPDWRQGVVTDNGNWILDVYNLDFTDALRLEEQLNNIVGVVESGVFARRLADRVVVAHIDGTIEELNLSSI